MEDPEAAAEVGKEAANTAVKSQPEKMIHTPTPSSQTSLDPQEGKSDSPVHADEANKNDVQETIDQDLYKRTGEKENSTATATNSESSIDDSALSSPNVDAAALCAFGKSKFCSFEPTQRF